MIADSQLRSRRPRLALTAGEPAGIGPELLIRLATTPLQAELVAITDRNLLRRAAQRCGVAIDIVGAHDARTTSGSCLRVEHVPLGALDRKSVV